MRVHRFDPGTTRKVEHMADGGIRVHAYLTRPGVFEYTRGDGTVVLEYRPPEEVFAASAIESMRGIAVTNLHPAGLVTASNWKEYAVGHVENPRREGDYVAAELVIHEESARSAVLRGDRVEISSGYTCEIDLTPGIAPDGKPFHQIQRGMVYNHEAMGPRDWGRLGPTVQMHLDAADAVRWCVSESAHSAQLRGDANAENGEERGMKIVRIDGVDYQVDDAAAPHLERAFAAVTKERDEQKTRADSEKARADKAEGSASAEKARADKAETELATATDPKRFDARVAARVQLERDAVRVIGVDDQGAEPKFDGQSDDDVRRKVILAVDPEAKLDGKTGDFLVGACDVAIRAHRQQARASTFDAGREDVGAEREDELDLEYVRALAIQQRADRFDGRREGV